MRLRAAWHHEGCSDAVAGLMFVAFSAAQHSGKNRIASVKRLSAPHNERLINANRSMDSTLHLLPFSHPVRSFKHSRVQFACGISWS